MNDLHARSPLLGTAQQYLQAGLSVLPAERTGDAKRPVGRWAEYQRRRPMPAELHTAFLNHIDHLCVVTGEISGNLEVIDFDMAGEAFDAWCSAVDAAAPGLRDRLVVESTPSSGRHVFYRSQTAVGKSVKLAQRRIDTAGAEEIQVLGKAYKPRQDHEGRWHVTVTLIETRGERSVCVCSPSRGYSLLQGTLTRLPLLSDLERGILRTAAWELNEVPIKPMSGPTKVEGSDRPGDDFNARGDVRALLERHGWVRVREGSNEHWRRPGKSEGTSATLRGGVFYVFSSNATPFEPMEAYAPFAVYTLLEHEGDWAAAATALRREGYGRPAAISVCPDASPAPSGAADPGPMPLEWLRVPGFVGEVMDFCLATAPYPNPVLAFCGALTLQAFLAGRNVRDPGDNRPNLYVLGLAHSAAGKDSPRKLNVRILEEVGLSQCLADRFASGEGLQDALLTTPCMLAQTDEIDGLLQSINRAKDGRMESLMAGMLTAYSSANSVIPVRRRAGEREPGVVVQPCLVMFGTAIPTHYYAALSERMLTNGLFSRMSTFESYPRASGQEPIYRPVPTRVLETAHWWAEMSKGAALSGGARHEPTTWAHTARARALLIDIREDVDAKYRAAEGTNDAVSMAVLGRVGEHVRKFSLVYAVSKDPYGVLIDDEAVRWAYRLVSHQANRMLFMAADHAAESVFDARAMKAIRKLREAPNRTVPHSHLLKAMKLSAREFGEVMETLIERGEVASQTAKSGGRTGILYSLPR